jgi:hypothetical protein
MRCKTPSTALLVIHLITTTRSCSGSIQTMLDPPPLAAKLEARALAHSSWPVLSHQM